MGQGHIERIRPARFAFYAEFHATEPQFGKETWGETTNLSRGGCYVRTSQPFTEGTLLLIEIRKNRVRFVTDARVAYAIEHEGMGLAFLNVPAAQLCILEDWLASVAGTAAVSQRDQMTGSR